MGKESNRHNSNCLTESDDVTPAAEVTDTQVTVIFLLPPYNTNMITRRNQCSINSNNACIIDNHWKRCAFPDKRNMQQQNNTVTSLGSMTN